MKPYYQNPDGGITLYHGDCREVLPQLTGVDCLISDPPYPNRGGHFLEGIATARWVFEFFTCPRWLVFWHQLEVPPIQLPLVAHHVWHRSNTNRPDNYEAIYEFANEAERASRVFSFPVVYPGLTGCKEATGHPTQKNLKLMRRVVTLRPTRLILDPFVGSGTTLEAAALEGRSAIGIEIDEAYCEIAARRLEAAQAQLPLAA